MQFRAVGFRVQRLGLRVCHTHSQDTIQIPKPLSLARDPEPCTANESILILTTLAQTLADMHTLKQHELINRRPHARRADTHRDKARDRQTNGRADRQMDKRTDGRMQCIITSSRSHVHSQFGLVLHAYDKCLPNNQVLKIPHKTGQALNGHAMRMLVHGVQAKPYHKTHYFTACAPSTPKPENPKP